MRYLLSILLWSAMAAAQVSGTFSASTTGGAAAPTYTLAVDPLGGNGSVVCTPGTISCGTPSNGICTNTYTSGSVVCTETPTGGDTFTAWGADCGTTTATTATLTMTANHSCSATFSGATSGPGTTVPTAIPDLLSGSVNYSPGLNSSGAQCNGSNGCTAVSFNGGLYGTPTSGGTNTIPTQHLNDGVTLAGQVAPISGKNIVIECIGMSNAGDECSALQSTAPASGHMSSSVTIINATQAGMSECYWTVATGTSYPAGCGTTTTNPYDSATTILVGKGFADVNVEVVLLKTTTVYPQNNFGQSGMPCTAASTPTGTYWTLVTGSGSVSHVACQGQSDALTHQGYLSGVLRAIKARYPNIKQVFTYSRIYGGYGTATCGSPTSMPCGSGGSAGPISPENLAYEAGYGTKWAINAQIARCPTSSCTGSTDAVSGDLAYEGSSPVAPWVDYAGYLWANGTTANASGLYWCFGQSAAPCSSVNDFLADGIHPSLISPSGAFKTASCSQIWGLCYFFLNNAYTHPWFYQ